MIELDYQLGYPYSPALVFAALTNVADYPTWQSDVVAARVHGGGPARPGAEVSVVRKVLGRTEYFRMYVNEYEQDRGLVLKTVAHASQLLTHAFTLKPMVSRDCCWLNLRVTLVGTPSLAEPLVEASLLYRVIETFDSLRSYLAASGDLGRVGAGRVDRDPPAAVGVTLPDHRVLRRHLASVWEAHGNRAERVTNAARADYLVQAYRPDSTCRPGAAYRVAPELLDGRTSPDQLDVIGQQPGVLGVERRHADRVAGVEQLLELARELLNRLLVQGCQRHRGLPPDRRPPSAALL